MKKLFTLLFAAGILTLASCGGSETKSEDAAKTSADSIAAANKADSLLNKMSGDTITKVSADTTKK